MLFRSLNTNLGCWMHVTLVYLGGTKTDASSFRAYYNGNPVLLAAGNAIPAGAGGNYLDRNLPGYGSNLIYDMDEVRFYQRAIRLNEAPLLAKNRPSCPPEIVKDPVGLELLVGASGVFSGEAWGDSPLSYQW